MIFCCSQRLIDFVKPVISLCHFPVYVIVEYFHVKFGFFAVMWCRLYVLILTIVLFWSVVESLVISYKWTKRVGRIRHPININSDNFIAEKPTKSLNVLRDINSISINTCGFKMSKKYLCQDWMWIDFLFKR